MLVLVSFLALFALVLLLPHIRAPSCTSEPHIVDRDTTDGQFPAPGSIPPIPRIIWAYWHTREQPLVVERCLHSWRQLNPGFAVNMVSAETLFEFVSRDELPQGFAALTPARQSDWLRLYLLRRYGGIWLDASIVLTRSLDWMIDQQTRRQAHFLGFYLDRYTQRPECPVIDSWCLSAPPDSAFVRDWYAEFTEQALTLGDQAYLLQLRSEGISESVLQNIASPDYMVIHVCAQRVLHRGGAYRLSLIRAEDSAYFYQAKGRWKRPLLFLSLLIFKRPLRPPALIKLRGGERRKLETWLRRGWFSRGSMASQLLSSAP